MTRISLLFSSVLLISCWAQAQEPKPVTRFQFREPSLRAYVLEANAADFDISSANTLTAYRESEPSNRVEIQNRVVVKLIAGSEISQTLAGSPLKISRIIAKGTFILQASDARTAIHEAERLANLTNVVVSSPVMRRTRELRSPYFYKPNDPKFRDQWHLEQRSTNNISTGVDLNVRAAWPQTRGAGIAFGFADDGVELTHPDLAARAVGMPHYNFNLGTTDGAPTSSADRHATPVAGLAAAELNNQTGGSGVAPEAKIASWKIFNGNTLVTSDEQLMDMFQYASNSVAVQNHSWGYNGLSHDGFGFLENIGIQNAIDFGRGGRGVVMVRSVPDKRATLGNANDDSYASDPRVIATAAVLFNGRASSDSDRGACLLVGAPGGEFASPTVFTTDRAGTLGYNMSASPSGDYTVTNGVGFYGTSAAAPQIAGIAALILSANTNLTYRDVQQILIHSARHIDLADPDLTTNGAGFRVSHNVGFGIPDAGTAVSLARNWINRPARTGVSLLDTNFAIIPDDGLRVLIPGAPTNLYSLAASPSTGLNCDAPTALLPLIDVGFATNTITTNLSGKAALIQRGGGATFATKIQNAAQAGAGFAVIFNNTNSPDRIIMTGTDFSPIPAVMINQKDGAALRDFILTNNAAAQIRVFPTNYHFYVTNSLICEHVGVRVRTDNLRRADIRITLQSPMGTRSVLQAVNQDPSINAPIDWTYFSTHHFYESSAGFWVVAFSDANTGAVAEVQEVELQILGAQIADNDMDGLDDAWENLNFGSLANGPADDLDKDGYQNAREQIMGTNPNVMEVPFQLDFSRADELLTRLSWSSSTNFSYEVQMGTNPANLNILTNVAGKFPETELLLPYTNSAQFFQVRAQNF